MSHIIAADVAYSIFAEAEIYVEQVDDSAVGQLVTALMALTRLEPVSESPASRLLDLGRYAAYRACSSPLAWNSAALGIADLAHEMGDLLFSIAAGSNTHRAASDVANVVASIGIEARNPLSSPMIEILATGTRGEVAVVLPTARHVTGTSELLRSLGAACPVYTARTIAFAPRTETLVAVGPPRWYNDAMITAPRAFGTTFLQVGRQNTPTAPSGLLGRLKPRHLRHTGATRPSDQQPLSPAVDLMPSLDWTEVLRRANATGAVAPDSECEQARLAGIAGGFYTWLSVDGERSAYTVSLNGSNTAEILRSTSAALREGDIVLLRADSAESDFIRTMADSQFGAAVRRPDQLRWKSALRAECRRIGVRSLAIRLSSVGVTESNLRHWLSESSIRPRDRGEFAATCAAIGLAADAEALWSALSAIQGAHVEAGFRISELLRSALLERDLTDLRQQGVIEMEIPGAGAVGAYCIEHISDITRAIPIRQLNRRTALEDGAWRG